MTPRRLVYAATARCPCGAGLAYDPRSNDRCWDCSAILLGTAIPTGQPGSVQHTDKLPFSFYEIKAEHQPSARGATTRPTVLIYSTTNVENLWPQEWHVGIVGPSTPDVYEPIVKTLYTPKHQWVGGVLKCKIWGLLHGYGWLPNPEG